MTQEPTVKKQFIAGASCPKCNELDVLIFYRLEDIPVKECVECGYVEKYKINKTIEIEFID